MQLVVTRVGGGKKGKKVKNGTFLSLGDDSRPEKSRHVRLLLLLGVLLLLLLLPLLEEGRHRRGWVQLRQRRWTRLDRRGLGVPKNNQNCCSLSTVF